MEFELYFSDLTPEAQQRVLNYAGVQSASDMNWDVFPITEIIIGNDEDNNEDEE